MAGRTKNEEATSALFSSLTNDVKEKEAKKKESNITKSVPEVKQEKNSKDRGRPVSTGEKKSKNILLQLKPSLHQVIKDESDRVSMSVNAFITLLITEGLEKRRLL